MSKSVHKDYPLESFGTRSNKKTFNKDRTDPNDSDDLLKVCCLCPIDFEKCLRILTNMLFVGSSDVSIWFDNISFGYFLSVSPSCLYGRTELLWLLPLCRYQLKLRWVFAWALPFVFLHWNHQYSWQLSKPSPIGVPRLVLFAVRDL